MQPLWLHSKSVSGVRLGCKGQAQASFLSARKTGRWRPPEGRRRLKPAEPWHRGLCLSGPGMEITHLTQRNLPVQIARQFCASK